MEREAGEWALRLEGKDWERALENPEKVPLWAARKLAMFAFAKALALGERERATGLWEFAGFEALGSKGRLSAQALRIAAQAGSWASLAQCLAGPWEAAGFWAQGAADCALCAAAARSGAWSGFGVPGHGEAPGRAGGRAAQAAAGCAQAGDGPGAFWALRRTGLAGAEAMLAAARLAASCWERCPGQAQNFGESLARWTQEEAVAWSDPVPGLPGGSGWGALLSMQGADWPYGAWIAACKSCAPRDAGMFCKSAKAAGLSDSQLALALAAREAAELERSCPGAGGGAQGAQAGRASL